MRSPLPHAVATAVAALAVLAAAPAARADDAAMKASITAAYAALAPKERAAAEAIARFNRFDARVAARSRVAVRALRGSLRVFRTLLEGQQPSTPQGTAAQRALLRALGLEAAAMTRVDRAMMSAGHDPIAATNRLIRRANATLRRAARAAEDALRRVAALEPGDAGSALLLRVP